MAIDPEKLLALKIPDIEHSYSEKDAILYALGIGLGQDARNADELSFVYEKELKILPTFALVLGYSAFWLRDLVPGIDWVKVVHGEQGLALHRPLTPRGQVIGRTRIVDVIDKGAAKGALIYSQRLILDEASGEKIATLTQTTFCRGDGGFGGPARASPPPHAIPQRASPPAHGIPARPPDFVCELSTRPDTALIYRLSGDLNPLHVDQAFAAAAGFPRPILHGLATFGVAGHALLKTMCDYTPERLVAMSGRFSAPVFPGESIRTQIWRDGPVVSFRAHVAERGVVAIDNGRAEVT